MKKFILPILAAAVTISGTACSNAGGSATTIPSQPIASVATPVAAVPSVTSSAKFTITIPAKVAASSNSRKPKYISSATASVKITLVSVNGVASTMAPLVSNVGPGTTSITMPNVPVGNDVFSASAYDATNASGNLLSSGTASGAIVSGVTTSIPLTLVQTVVPDSGANVYALSNTQMVETNSGSKTVKLTITGLTSANAITTDVSGNIYINHSPNGQDTVVKYSPTGTLLKTIPYNTIPGEWYGNAIAVSPNGATIWVEDSHNGNALYRFDGSTGAPTIIRDGNIGTASGLATDSSGNLFVMSTQAWSIAKLNSAGVYQTKVTQSAGGFGVSPSSITVDGQNNVLMSVSGSNGSPGSISKFSNSLAYLDSNTALPSTWIIPGASAPIGTVVSDANSNLFISLMNNYQISGISNGAVVSTVSMNDLRAFTVR